MSIMAQEVSFTFYGDDNTGIGPPESSEYATDHGYKADEVGLLEMTMKMYHDSMIRDLHAPLAWDTIMGGMPKPKPITRRRRWEIYLKARWHWLFGWRIINKTDHWHKREDCDGW